MQAENLNCQSLLGTRKVRINLVNESGKRYQEMSLDVDLKQLFKIIEILSEKGAEILEEEKRHRELLENQIKILQS